MRSKTKHIFLVALVICAVVFVLVACSNTNSDQQDNGIEPERIALTGKYYLLGTPIDIQNIIITEGYTELLTNFRITTYIYGIPYTGLYNYGYPQSSTSTGEYFYYGGNRLGILWDGEKELTYWVYGGDTIQSGNFIYKIGESSYVRPDEKTVVTAPTSGGNQIYNGQEQTASISSNEYYTVSSEKGTNVGEYSVTLTLNDTEKYVWYKTNDAEPLILKWYIIKAKVEKPTLPSQSITYDGNLKTCDIEMSPYYTIIGNTGVEAGSYTATIELNDTDNYEWRTGGTSPHTIIWTINKKQVVRPSPATQSFIYDGSEKEFKIPETSYYTVSSNTATNAGNYTATVTLNDTDNFEWSSSNNGSKNDTMSFSWTIAKVGIERPTHPIQDILDYTYDGTEKTYPIPTSTLYSITGNKATMAGVYTAVITINDFQNYEWSTYEWGETYSNCEPMRFEWRIWKQKLNIPTVEITSFEYDGTQKTIQIPDSTLYIASTDGETLVGQYYATITLIDTINYEWDSTSDITIFIPWQIIENEGGQENAASIVLGERTNELALNQDGIFYQFTLTEQTDVAFTVISNVGDIHAYVYHNGDTTYVNDTNILRLGVGNYFVKIANKDYGTAYGHFLVENLNQVTPLSFNLSTGTKTVGNGGLWYKLEINHSAAVAFEVIKQSGNDLGVEVYRSTDLSKILSSLGSFDASVSAPLISGIYYVQLHSTDYLFNTKATGSLVVKNNQLTLGQSSGVISVPYGTQGVWYTLENTSPMQVVFTLSSDTYGNKYAFIYDENDLSTSIKVISNNYPQTMTLSKGLYFIKIQQSNYYGYETLTLLVSEFSE